jgi:hypothetical protein
MAGNTRKEKTITQEQIRAIRETCDLFEAMGGEVIE